MTTPVNTNGKNRPPARFPVGEDGLTLKERLFVAEIQVDWNKTYAAIRAGYSKHSAGDIGFELMQKPKIIAAVGDAMESRIAKAGINAKWVLAKLVDTHDVAVKIAGSTALAGRLRALELIGRHVDVDAFRGTAGFRPIGEGPAREWDLTRLDDKELRDFERLLAKISTDEPSDAGSREGGNSGATDEGGTGNATP